MKKKYILLVALFISSLGFGQTTIYNQDFETLNSGYTASSTEGSGFTDVFNRSNPNIGGNSSFIWAVEDTNVTPATLTLNQIDVTGYTDFIFSIDMLAHHFNDWDNSDELLITYSIDGGASQNLLWVQNAGGAFNQAASLDTDFDGNGDCGSGILPALTTGNSGCNVTNNSFATFSSATIPLSGNSTLDIVLQFNGLTSNDEGIYLDNIIVEANGGSSNDSDTEVYEPTPQVAATTITAANVTTLANAEDVFGFIIEDQGSGDGVGTNVTTMRFVPGANNTADWTDHIQGITLTDENLVTYTPTVTISDTEITLEFSTPIVIGDGSALEFLLGLYLNTTNIVDGSIIQFQIDATSSGFEANTSGSTFVDPFTLGDITGQNITINVDVTQLVFTQQPPASVLVNTAMTDVILQGQDVNGNVDTGYNLDVNITSSGTLTASPITVTAVNGVATFTGITHTATGAGLVLTADDTLFPTVNSTGFDVTDPPVGPVVIAIQDFDGTTPEWTYTTTPGENSAACIASNDVWNVVSSLGNLTVPNSTGNFFGSRDLSGASGCGTSGTGTIDFVDVDISGHNNVVLTFDYEVDGFNSGSDELSYIITFDSSPETEVFLCDGCNSQNIEGTVSINIPNGTNTVSLQIRASFDGGSDYFGVDNFKIEGEVIPTVITYTFNGTWSPSDPNGTSTTTENILIASGDAIISTNTDINTVVVNPGASLTVNTGATLAIADVTEGLTLESSSDSFSSLILNGTISGTVNYERFVNQIGTGAPGNGGNDLISVPLTNFTQNYQTFLSLGTPQNRDILATNGANTVHAFGPYDNENLQYVNYQTYNPLDPPSPAAEALVVGKGYRAASTSGANLFFTGDVLNTNVTIGVNRPASGSQWNLIGNPYTSFVDAKKFIEANTALFDPTAVAIYAYNSNTYSGSAQTNGNFTVINLGSIDMFTGENFNIAPGQGFFIATDDTAGFSGTAVFNTGPTATEDMRTNTGTDDYILGRSNNTTNYMLKLALNSTTESTTSFYFNDNSTLGLDLGYDAAVFGENANNFPIYSHLVQDNTGKAMAIQSISNSDLANVSIPLGVNASQGNQITFSINTSTLPSTVNVYLEDNVTNTVTLLNNGDYTITPNANINGTGRFYLRLTDSALSIDQNTFDDISIYANTTAKTIVIAGQLTNKTIVNIYDVQGRLITTATLNTTSRSQSINVNNVSSGIYVVQLTNGTTHSKAKKVILK